MLRPPGLSTLLFCALPATVAGAAGGPPDFGSDVILIVLDDVGTDRLTFYVPELDPDAGEPDCGPAAPFGTKPYPCTPTLNRLRTGGMLFTQAYTNPSCSPSRASILTGRYARRHGLGRVINEGWSCGTERSCDGSESIADDEILLPELLRGVAADSGFDVATGAFGKYHLTYVVGDECHPIENGFEVFQGNMGNSGRNLVGPDHFDWVYTIARELPSGGCEVLRSEPIDVATTCPPDNRPTSWDATVTRRAARRWIDAQLAQERRFFAYVSFNPPHKVHQVPPMCRLSAATRDRLAALGLGETGALLDCPPGTCEEETVALYNATVEAIDREIKLLLKGLPPDITIIVIGDNGTPPTVVDAEPTELPPCRSKGSLYQLGVRVPLIVSGPAVPDGRKGSTCFQVVDSVDLWRTVANVVGLTDLEIDAWLGAVAPGHDVDSRSILTLLDNPWADGERAFAYTERFAPNQGGVGDFAPTHWDVMVTDGRYKLVRRMEQLEWSGGQPVGGTLREEMFKITIDPHEARPLCAAVPIDCTSECPEPACHSVDYPGCGDPDCTDPEVCCPPTCPMDASSPFFEHYLELRDRLSELAGLR